MVRLIIVLVVVWIVHFWWSLFIPQRISEPVSITVVPGWSVSQILLGLEEKDLIKSVWESRIYLALLGVNMSLQAGEYLFEGSVSSRSVLESIVRGDSQSRERTITFIEGWTVRDMGAYLESIDLLSKAEFLEASQKNYSFGFASQVHNRNTMEGYLFPDTYRVFDDITGEALVQKMLENFEKKFSSDLKETLIKQGRTIDDAIILASILEKEVSSFEDKKLASDVFLKRLSIGIALQADSTVNYITGKNVPRATLEDIQIDSSYNTYKYRGLPPGPISNPGLDSIRAAVNPRKNDYLYFLTTPEGEAIFSRTFEEHNALKRQYY